MAREKAREHRNRIRDGANPLQEKREQRVAMLVEKAKSKTFRQCAEAYVEAHRAEWKNAKHAAQWSATLETYAYPTLGDLPVSAIDTTLVLDVLRPIWQTKTETASRLRGRIEVILDAAKTDGLRTGDNPAQWKGHLQHKLSARSKQKVEHHAALPYPEVGAFMVALRARGGVTPRALEFAILTAARSGEVRGATWAELDLKHADGARWTVPAARMKAGKEHIVPLSDAAVALLEALPQGKAHDYVFPAPRGGMLSDMSLTAVLKRMERADLTQHGFRSTFRTWAGERSHFAKEVIEQALAHQLKDKVDAAYFHGLYMEKRKALMADWTTYCAKQPTIASVTPLREAA